MTSSHRRPKRISFVMSDLGGGTGDHLLAMMKHWDRADWEPRIISEAPLTSRLAPEVPVAYIGGQGRRLRYPIAQVVGLSRVAGRLKREPADLVHCYFFWSIMYGRFLKRIGRVAHLVENREDEGLGWGPREYVMLRWGKAIPDRVICVSEAVRRVALEREGLDPARTAVVHNGVEIASPDLDQRARVRHELGIEDGVLVVGMVSNFDRPVKGVGHLLEAIPRVVQAWPRVCFVVFGRGREEGALRAQARALGVEAQVKFAGFRPDIERYYCAMDVSVLTSLSEGLSIALLESMNHGLPVVVTRVGGNPEVVMEGETGYLVPPRDPVAFAERVVRLLSHPELRARLGEAGRRRVEGHFDLRRTARRYLEVYESVLAAQG